MIIGLRAYRQQIGKWLNQKQRYQLKEVLASARALGMESHSGDTLESIHL